MKYFYFLCFFSFLITAKSQTNSEILLNNTWYLQYLDFTEEFPSIIYPPDSDEFEPIILNFYVENDEMYFHTAVCASIDGIVNSLSESEISYTITNYSSDETLCTETENHTFEEKYLSFFNMG